MSYNPLNRFYLKNPIVGRRENKRQKDAARIKVREENRKRDFPEICYMCGGYMSWCSCCEVWSSNCCCEYGTCECS